MADNWDDSDDDWDKDDDEIDKKLGLLKVGDNAKTTTATTTAIYDDDDDEDLTLKDKEMDEKLNAKLNKVKGSALAQKKAAEMAAKEELELARKAMEMEAEMESNMSPEERRLAERAREEADARAMADDLFGGVDSGPGGGVGGGPGQSMMAGDKVIMKDLKDHLRHAKKVGECITDHGKINLCAAFLKEVIQQCKDVLDDDAITDIIKSCNVIKNEKVQQAKRKVKGQAQKSKKVDNAAIKKKMDKHNDTFGDNDNYDEYDQLGGQYEDDFF
jgi:translation initiation factor 3 subunit J